MRLSVDRRRWLLFWGINFKRRTNILILNDRKRPQLWSQTFFYFSLSFCQSLFLLSIFLSTFYLFHSEKSISLSADYLSTVSLFLLSIYLSTIYFFILSFSLYSLFLYTLYIFLLCISFYHLFISTIYIFLLSTSFYCLPLSTIYLFLLSTSFYYL